jgi:4-hydroxy-tetrahydrodipicolinate reductase
MKISVLGATGVMGGYVVKTILQNEGLSIGEKISSKDNIKDLFKNSEAIIDFSSPSATESMLKYAFSNKLSIPLVIGTTGLSQIHSDLMTKCSATAPIFYSPNMSFLVAILNTVLHTIAKLLNKEFDAEIFESHHRLKKDAPSGTALMLGKTIAKARNQKFDDVANFVRHGTTERKKGEIGFSVQRGGNTIGIHEVSFAGDSENIKIRHEAYSKEIFAKGAVQIAKWIVKQKCGFYTMNDFIKDSIAPIVESSYEDLFKQN